MAWGPYSIKDFLSNRKFCVAARVYFESGENAGNKEMSKAAYNAFLAVIEDEQATPNSFEELIATGDEYWEKTSSSIEESIATGDMIYYLRNHTDMAQAINCALLSIANAVTQTAGHHRLTSSFSKSRIIYYSRFFRFHCSVLFFPNGVWMFQCQ